MGGLARKVVPYLGYAFNLFYQKAFSDPVVVLEVQSFQNDT